MNEELACSVIIPSYRSESVIRACLKSVMEQDFPLPYEVLVVDSSPDNTPLIIQREFPQVRLIHLQERSDPALARNIGAQSAQAKIYAFIDSDCSAPKGWLASLYQGIQAGYQAVGGSIINANRESLVSWAGYFCEFREFFPVGHSRDVGNLTLGNAAYSKQAFWEVGGFPVGCFPQEDQVFHHDFKNCGFRIRFDPDIRVTHNHRTRLADFLNHQRRIGSVNAQVVRNLGLPGAAFVHRPWLARLSYPGFVALRWARTLWACRRIERGLVWKQPLLIILIALGMAYWGFGFVKDGIDARTRG